MRTLNTPRTFLVTAYLHVAAGITHTIPHRTPRPQTHRPYLPRRETLHGTARRRPGAGRRATKSPLGTTLGRSDSVMRLWLFASASSGRGRSLRRAGRCSAPSRRVVVLTRVGGP